MLFFIIKIKKNHKLDLNDKIKNHKNFDKIANETNQNKRNQTKINIITIEKIHKFDLNDKIKN